ncbi:hypothetical protein [Chryseobacterium sp. JM1]|uniref:hypothetical protein n=1 Tax=Chryseobacterium sp. JM1 TaxID=1233950 RepID=UPI0004E6EEBA|nr:hypothetical protein [Chryseobacterium sp. JM1]KFF16179.1 hypothetical protein IW22_23055 [Chryseobacterium sp. JM1]
MNEEVMINNSPDNYNKNSFLIVNKTKENYIINIRGFMEEFGEVYKNGERLNPYLYKPISEPAGWNETECKENILLVPARKSIKAILHLSILRGWYKIDNDAEYTVDFETEHTKRSPYYYGCKQYVDSLVVHGYKIYDGTLKGKIKLIQKR